MERLLILIIVAVVLLIGVAISEWVNFGAREDGQKGLSAGAYILLIIGWMVIVPIAMWKSYKEEKD